MLSANPSVEEEEAVHGIDPRAFRIGRWAGLGGLALLLFWSLFGLPLAGEAARPVPGGSVGAPLSGVAALVAEIGPAGQGPAWATAAALPPDRPGIVPEHRWLEYDFSASLAPRTYRAGSLRLTIAGKDDGAGMIAPVVTLAAPGMRPHRLVGEAEPAGRRLRLAVMPLEPGARAPAVLVQGYTGGFQCCNHVQLAVPGAGGFRTFDLGDEWHGVSIPYPRDLDGDGRPELVFPDGLTAFHFTKQKDDFPLPVVIDWQGGKAVDVSRHPRFRPFFLAVMEKAEGLCRDPDPPTSAGACPAFVGAAARAGRLDAAWRVMLSVHKPDLEYGLPTRCADGRVGFCGKGRRFASYPAALEALLKQGGYIPADWHPPLA